MDGPRFDAFARSWSAAASRRSLLRLWVTVAAGGVAGLLGRGASAAPPTPCPGGHLCSGNCCEAGFEACCDGKCVEITVDRTRCHECGKTCPEGQSCCGNRCTILASDPANCGTCGHRCPAGATCVSGKCLCPEGQRVCNGRCINPNTNEHHCGRCGHRCPDGATCTGGTCHCPEGTKACSGACLDLQTNRHHCGTCDTNCTAALGHHGGLGPHGICVDGACVCAPGTACSGTATCIGPEHTYSTEGICCQHPLVAECCTDGPTGTGFAHCCTPGVDCLERDTCCPNGGRYARGGDVGCCNDTCTGGDGIAVACAEGLGACNPTEPCCSGLPRSDTGDCPCLPVGAACGGGEVPGYLQCCTGRCDNGKCHCLPQGEHCSSDDHCCAHHVCSDSHICVPAAG